MHVWALQTCTFEGPRASNTTKIPRKDTQRDTKERSGGGEREKKREILGLSTLRGPICLGLGAPPFGAPPFGAPGAPFFSSCFSVHFFEKKRKKTETPILAKVSQHLKTLKIGQSRLGQSRSQPLVHPTLSRSHYFHMFFTVFSRHLRCGWYLHLVERARRPMQSIFGSAENCLNSTADVSSFPPFVLW